ncbi:hypothetical protein GCM10027321_42110 [Massilia terrae]|uniref:Helix-turn-helix transcriptional regulator n=1 Tax=Massilia terrae TaxID=1811224 RepID=A0ABT2D4K0_9BURK|nr:helix-turn-helix transcriptional regulator [Massilia terrae]MCS0661054.1 helix-turn-helix transcriptional regulator [Massilia terrae]
MNAPSGIARGSSLLWIKSVFTQGGQHLADHVHWSVRHFSQVFQTQTGMAPAKAIEKLRLEVARTMIDDGHSSIARIAAATGFDDEERMRRAFVRALGQPPKAFIQQARSHQDNILLS